MLKGVRGEWGEQGKNRKRHKRRAGRRRSFRGLRKGFVKSIFYRLKSEAGFALQKWGFGRGFKNGELRFSVKSFAL